MQIKHTISPIIMEIFVYFDEFHHIFRAVQNVNNEIIFNKNRRSLISPNMVTIKTLERHAVMHIIF